MPQAARGAPAPRRRHRVAIALALPLAAAVSGGCGAVRPSARPPAEPTVQAGAPASFVRSTSETRSTRLIDVRDGLTKPLAWRTALEVLGTDHTIDARDESVGFAMTPWEATVVRDGVPDLRYLTRVTLRFIGDDWKQLQVRSEAKWRSRGDEWDIGFDEVLLEKVTSELQARLGKRAGAAP
jgi:hypothetical protein